MTEREIKDNIEICRKKFEIHMNGFDGKELYELPACGDGKYHSHSKGNNLLDMYSWVASFVSGLAPIYYLESGDRKYIDWAYKFKEAYHEKVFEYPLDTMHDLGFLYIPYCINLYNITNDSDFKNDALKAADELLKRFDINGRYIDAWRRMDSDEGTGRAIIDCMMNIPLLLWAWKTTGNTIYRDVAKAHADMTEKIFIRKDKTVCHSFEFDRNTGEVLHESNCCGFGNGSYWSRGVSWAIYGFAVAARYLQEDKYYNTAMELLDKYLDSLDENDIVPVWDFCLPDKEPAKIATNCPSEASWDESDIKNREFNKDSSAAAVVACACMELLKHEDNERLKAVVQASLNILCSDKYFNKDINVEGILKRQNGQMVYATYGDYYFVQFLYMCIDNKINLW